MPGESVGLNYQVIHGAAQWQPHASEGWLEAAITRSGLFAMTEEEPIIDMDDWVRHILPYSQGQQLT